MEAADLPHNFLQSEYGEEVVEEQLPVCLPEEVHQEEEQPIEYAEWIVEEGTSKYLVSEEHEEFVHFSHEEPVYVTEDDVQFFDDQTFEEMYPEEEIYGEESNDGYYRNTETIPIVEMSKRKLTIVECEYCGLVLKHPSKIKAHMRTHTGEKPFECTMCGARFTQKVPMLNHMRKHLGDTPYQCSFCEKKYVNGAQKRAHELRHQGMKRRGPPKPQLKPPRRRIAPVSSVPTTSMKIMAENTKPSVGVVQPSFIQPEKPLSPTASKRLDEIIEAIAAGPIKNKKKPMDSRSSLLAQCNVCGLMLRHPSKIQEHMRTHTGEKPFGCTVCSLRFARMGSLKVHMGRKHAEERKVRCSWECGALFVSIGQRNEHERVVHSGIKRYMCSVPGCRRMFARRAALMKHRMSDHPALHKPLFDPHEVNTAEEIDNQFELAVKPEYTSDEILSNEEVEKLLLPNGLLLLDETQILEGEFIDDDVDEIVECQDEMADYVEEGIPHAMDVEI